jgi:hypothetical protein
MLMLSPAAALAAGAVAAQVGVPTYSILFPAAVPILWALVLALRRVIPLPHHPLWPLAIVNLVALLALSTSKSLWSPLFAARPEPASPEAFAVLVASALAFGTFAPPYLTWKWPGRVVLVGLLVWGGSGVAWWTPLGLETYLLIFACWLIFEGIFTWHVLPALAILPGLRIVGYGVTYAPHGLIESLDDVHALNLYTYLRFFVSPIVIGTAILASGFALLGDRFFLHRTRGLIRRDSRRACLLYAALAASALGLFQPWMLFVALYLSLAALGVLLRDALVEV